MLKVSFALAISAIAACAGNAQAAWAPSKPVEFVVTAGPGGGTATTPVGTVCVAVADRRGVATKTIRVPRHEMLADVVTGELVKLPGVSRTQTMVAFEVFSRHDLESMFSIGS